jgi:hypothetical protein
MPSAAPDHVDAPSTVADLRLRQIAFATHDLGAAAAQLAAVFQLPPGYNDPGIIHYGLRNVVLPVGGDFLEIVEPVEAEASAARYLARRGGDSGYMVILQAADAHAHRERTRGLGASIVDVLDRREHVATHFHPREFGGVLVSIDAAPGAANWRDPGSSWHPAGPDRLGADGGLVHGIAAVDIASADPAATAAQWGRMLDAEPQARDNRWRIDLLHQAAIRFVHAAAGAPAGIAGLTLFADDADRILRRAHQAKVPVAGDSVMICNVPVHVIARV